MLLEANRSNIDQKSKLKSRWTALHRVTQLGHANTAYILLEHGANANSQDADGITPLLQAATNGSLVLINMLLEHGADPNFSSKDGVGPIEKLLRARFAISSSLECKEEDFSCLVELINAGCSLNFELTHTSLFRDNSYPKALLILLEAGVEIPLSILESCGYPEKDEYLRAAHWGRRKHFAVLHSGLVKVALASASAEAADSGVLNAASTSESVACEPISFPESATTLCNSHLRRQILAFL